MSEPLRIGTVNDAAERYGTDAARVWQLIAHRIPVVCPDGGRLVVLIAPEDEREVPPWSVDGEATLWIVSEVDAT